MNAEEGEQDTTPFMPLPPYQSTLLNELSSQLSFIYWSDCYTFGAGQFFLLAYLAAFGVQS